MSKIFAILGLLGFSMASPNHNNTFDEIRPSKRLTWYPCETKFFCAKLKVPLDYQHPSLGHATIPLLRYPAKKGSPDGPYQGMLLINPGGPGLSGVDEARENATDLQAVLGTNWDIVGFDPRGIYLSEPHLDCANSTTHEHSRSLKSRSIPTTTDDYYNSFIEGGKEFGAYCEKTSGGRKCAGPHMSTAVNARDMVSIVDAFEQTYDGKRAHRDPHLVNFYGVSYGTVLGQTFASMFPDRVGRLAIDGVVSPEGYLANFTSPFINHLDGLFGLFFVYCHEAGETACPYYTGSTPKDIFERFNQSLVQLDAKAAEAKGCGNASDIESALLTLQATILATSYSPLLYFNPLAEALVELEVALKAKNIMSWTEKVNAVFGDPTPAGLQSPEFVIGVLCSDQQNKLYNKTLQDLQPFIKQLKAQSIIGEVWMKPVLECTGWSIKAKEIFTGPFGGQTATPILFVSNTFDPVSPIEDSISNAPKYSHAQVLTVDGMGHISSAANNPCAHSKLKDYFQHTKLPGKDNYCPLAKGPFGVTLKGSLTENLEKAGLANLHW